MVRYITNNNRNWVDYVSLTTWRDLKASIQKLEKGYKSAYKPMQNLARTVYYLRIIWEQVLVIKVQEDSQNKGYNNQTTTLTKFCVFFFFFLW